MNINPVSISLSSYGAELVRHTGQEAFIALVAEAGAVRIELREELLRDESLAALARSIADQKLDCLYSSPLELWIEDESAHNPNLEETLERARMSGAEWLKVSLGHFNSSCDLPGLARHLASQDVRLLVENDQTPQGGRIDHMLGFFNRVDQLNMPIGMTFDVGNWCWQQQSALSAAQQLGRYVEYVHFKAVSRDLTGKLIALPPRSEDLVAWRHLLACMAPGVPRAIEYPLQGDDLLEVTRQQVKILGGLSSSSTANDPVTSHV